MSNRSRWAVAVGVLIAGLAPGAGIADGQTVYRFWHGTLIENLDQAPANALTSGAAASSAPTYPLAVPSASSNTVQQAQPTHQSQTTILSNERTVTRWANPAYAGAIYASPSGSARHVGRLHMNTEDGFPEVYVLLKQTVDATGDRWVLLRIPARPNGQTGWVRRNELRRFGASHWLLVVNRRAERLTAYNNGRRVFRAPVGVGKPSTPTPAGHFWIRERFRVPDPSSPYFPYAMGTADYSTLSEWPGGGVVGIHGAWGKPWLIPGDPSHGCIRMHNNDDAWLVPRVPVGTPLHVI